MDRPLSLEACRQQRCSIIIHTRHEPEQLNHACNSAIEAVQYPVAERCDSDWLPWKRRLTQYRHTHTRHDCRPGLARQVCCVCGLVQTQGNPKTVCLIESANHIAVGISPMAKNL